MDTWNPTSFLRPNGSGLHGMCLVMALCVLLATPDIEAARPGVRRMAATAEQSTFVYTFPAPTITIRAGQTVVEQAEALQTGSPGEPRLPYYVATLPVPAGRRVGRVLVRATALQTHELSAPVSHTLAPFPLSQGPGGVSTPRTAEIYGRAALYPDALHAQATSWHKHHQELVSIPLFPIRLAPRENRLFVATELTITIHWIPATGAELRPAHRRPRDESEILALADLAPQPLTAATPATATSVTPLTPAYDLGTPSQLLPGDFEHVIISTDALLNAPGPHTLQTLSAARTAQGMTSTNVSLEWIEAHYDGTRPAGGSDTPTRIRNFVRDAYTQWGTRFLLLAGSADLIPVRRFYVPLVLSGIDYTTEMPVDMYYGCLDDTFDGDLDGRYGEQNDGPGGTEVDLVAEVYVGRLPVANATELADTVRKTLTYETQALSHYGRVVHVGEYLGFGGVTDYAKPSMEEIRLGGTYSGYTTTGFNTSSYAGDFCTTQNLYDADAFWDYREIRALMNEGCHLFNHLGHGTDSVCFKMSTQTMSTHLTNSIPFFAYSQACDVGRFDDEVNCVAETLTTIPYGAFAVIMNVRFGWGMANNTDGPSHKFHRRFWDVVLGQDIPYLGQANQLSKEPLRSVLNLFENRPLRWCYYEITCFGDPATTFARPLLTLAPQIEHEGLTNQYDTESPHTIEAEILPATALDPAALALIWQTGDLTQPTNITPLTMVGSHRYAADIPPQPMGRAVWYAIEARTLRGRVSVWPDGPGSRHRFDMTTAQPLIITGTPFSVGSVAPDYGLTTLASGVVVEAHASLHTLPSAGVRQRNIGWRGSGSVPPQGSGTNMTFALEIPSQLTWRWTNEFALAQISSPPGLLAETNWWTQGEHAVTITAPERIEADPTTQIFCGWYIDAVRQPLIGLPDLTVTNLLMLAPRSADARYLPEFQDDDGNGIADWWEYRHYAGVVDPSLDSDDDGATALAEFRDRTDPFDPASVPAPPWIEHLPLASPRTAPAPFRIVATITDSCDVASATLQWQLNGSGWYTTNLLNEGGTQYAAEIPAPGVLGDRFMYLLAATDPAGHARLDGPHGFDVAYALLQLSPYPTNRIILPPEGSNTDTLSISNAGNATLDWTLHPGLTDDAEGSPADWTADANQPWVLTSVRQHSPAQSWHSRLTTLPESTGSSVHATLDLRAVTLAPEARLEFEAWMETEPSAQRPGFVFDGGIIELSTDGGATFAQLPGPYTHRIHGWTESPWPEGTPCLADTGSGWKHHVFDLSNYAGQSVILRFNNGGDNNTNHEGWYLDDVAVWPLDEPWPTALMPKHLIGSLPPGSATTLVVHCSAEYGAPATRSFPISVVANDPTEPAMRSDWQRLIHHPPLLSGLTASQTSSNGEGIVTISLNVSDREGMPCTLSPSFSTDAGFTWQQPALTAATSTYGEVMLLPGATPPLLNIPTQAQGLPVTNRVTLTWRTQSPPAVTGVAPYTLVRLQAADADFFSLPVPSAPFMIDNAAPTPPTLAILSHAPSQWSTNRLLQASWTPASDGIGCGVASYALSITNGLAPRRGPDDVFTPALSSLVGPLADDGDWRIGISAIDAMGNTSAMHVLAPYCIDGTPPAADAASVAATLSAAGSYVVGPAVDIRWSGFTDAHAGIAGYYLALTNGGGRAVPPLLTATSGTITGIQNATNRIHVWAQDVAGNIGSAVSADVWVLSSTSDPDRDGMASGDEEIAGTDATDPNDLLRLMLPPVQSPGALRLVAWPTVREHRYTLYSTPSLMATNWQPLSGLDYIPGTGLSITAIVPTADSAFFRVGVQPE